MRRWMDEAVLAVQEAAKKLNSVSTQICGVEGKQDELLATIKVLSERVTNLEAATNYQACVCVSSKEKKHHPNVPLYERVRLSLLIFVHMFTVNFLWLCSLGICAFPLAYVVFLWLCSLWNVCSPSAHGIFVAVICAFPLAHVVYFVAVFSRDMCDPPSACGIR